MLKSNVYNRVLCRDSYRKFLRFYCSQNDKDVTNTEIPKADESPNKRPKIDPKDKQMELTAKINNLLTDMMQNNAKKSSVKFMLQNDDLGIERSRKIADKSNNRLLTPEQKIQRAAADVAESLGGDKRQVERELVTKALGDNQPPVNLNWNELIAGMDVDHNKPAEAPTSRAQEVHQAMSRRREGGNQTRSVTTDFISRSSRPARQSIDLNSGKPLNIFQSVTGETGTKLPTWSRLYEEELKLAVTHPPANYFQKMIQWTEQGKIWKFPIDNEQGLEEEQNIHFSEHIFLDTHLEGWCPQKGPIRHFMELVCVGLSKNPYLTVKDKKEHIMWFKDYFEAKKELLKEVGALSKDSEKPLNISA